MLVKINTACGQWSRVNSNKFNVPLALIPKSVNGSRYLSEFFAENWQFALVLPVAAVALAGTQKKIRFVAWVALGHLTYVFAIGGDWMPFFRFILPVLPLLFFLVQEGIWSIYDLAKSKIQSHWLNRACSALALLVMFGLNLFPLYRNRDLRAPISGKSFNPQQARIIGEHLSQTLPPTYVVAIEWAGIIPFYLRQPVLDIFGLNDFDITTKDFPGGRMGRGISPDYLVSRDPEVVVLSARTFDSFEKAAEGAHFKVKFARKGSHGRKFYSALTNQEYGYKICIMKIDEDTFWPLLIRQDLHQQNEFCQESAERSDVGKAKKHTKRKQGIM